MNFTKTLLAVALLATGSAAHASFVAGDAVLTVIDVTTGNDYAVDLGVKIASLQTTPSLTFTTDALYTAFVANEGAGDTILWNVQGAYATQVGGKAYNHFAETFVTGNVSDLSSIFTNDTAGVNNLATNKTNIIGTQTAQFPSTGPSAGATSVSIARAWDASIGGNVNAAAIGTALNFWAVERTGSAAISETLLATANFTSTATTGTLVIGSTSGGTTSAVPLPTSVWMFLSGIVGLLSMKRRSGAAA